MEYYGEMPWISIPHGDPRKKTLSRMFDVSGKLYCPFSIFKAKLLR